MSVYLKESLLSAVTLVIMLAVITIGVSFNTFAAAETKKKHSGEEVFSGVFFGQGEVADLFPEIWEQYQATTKNNNKELTEAKNKVISELKTKDPEFFNRFGEEMQSGEHLKIQSALETGAKGLREFQKSKQSDVTDNDFIYDNPIIIYNFVILHLQAHVIAIEVNQLPEMMSSSSLQRDELIVKIAVKLNATS